MFRGTRPQKKKTKKTFFFFFEVEHYHSTRQALLTSNSSVCEASVYIFFLCLCRRLFQPQQNLLTAPEAQVSPLRDTPNSSPAHRPKHSLPEEYTDPLANKKPRISHLSRKGDKSSLRTSEAVFHKNAVEVRTEDREGKRDSLDPRKLFDSLSATCWQEEEEEKEEVAKRLEPSPCALEEPQSLENHRRPDPDRPPSPLIVPVLSKRTAKRKKSKHKHRRQVGLFIPGDYRCFQRCLRPRPKASIFVL